jgi:hypothetical protein
MFYMAPLIEELQMLLWAFATYDVARAEGLNFPRQRLHEHLSFCTLNLCAQDNSHAYNLSS